jgi:hypothetical protein
VARTLLLLLLLLLLPLLLPGSPDPLPPRRSTFYIPYWDLPGASVLVPRQRRFRADLAVINSCLDELIASAQRTRQEEDAEALQNRWARGRCALRCTAPSQRRPCLAASGLLQSRPCLAASPLPSGLAPAPPSPPAPPHPSPLPPSFPRDYSKLSDPSLLRFLVDMRGEDATNKQLRDDLMTMLIAGHETTAAVLTWALFCLVQNPQAEAALLAEIDRVIGDRVPSG